MPHAVTIQIGQFVADIQAGKLGTTTKHNHIEPPMPHVSTLYQASECHRLTCQSMDAALLLSVTSCARSPFFPPIFEYTDGWMYRRHHRCTFVYLLAQRL
jgi:hypothetical protein